MSHCTACGKPLTIEIDPEEEEEEEEDDEFNAVGVAGGNVVPDSVELQCGCYFHWECLLDSYEMLRCPYCSKDILSHTSSGQEQILCNLTNEGGRQEGLDILPILKEESYLKTFPEERKCRAMLEFCAEGDVGAILDLLNDDQDEDFSLDGNAEGAARPIDVLRYQDPTGSLSTGLHIAISDGHEEVAWLLLLLASNLEPQSFPAEILQAAETLGARREDQTGKVDIRVLEDSNHRTAENLAHHLGGKWDSWVSRLHPIQDGVLPIM
ncbi:MAG: hypothetical protein Q9222_002906 [Ikaeria aurantiellina]